MNEFAQGAFQAVKGALGLMTDYNKVTDVKGDGLGEPTQEEYTSKFSDEDIIRLTSQWKASYSVYYGDVEPDQKKAYDYWIGKQKTDTLESLDGHDTVDNLIFEAVETFLPIANRANPDPLVKADSSSEGLELAKDVKNGLVDWADKTKLRMKLKKGTRHWVLSKLGVWKMSYNVLKDEIDCEALNPKNLILDKDGHIDESGLFTGEYIGEKKKKSASMLAEMFPKHSEFFASKSQGKMATKIEFIEWWYKGTDIFYTTEGKVLGKFKNPNWNYDGEEKHTDPETQEEISIPIMGKNHKFGANAPQAPYVFLSVFSTDEHPHDDTSLIIQNIPMQDMVNKRFRQIDKNADSQNNGALASGSSFTKEQAAEAATFLRKGGTVWVPNGDVNTAWKRDAAPSLPADIFQQLNDSRGELRNIFGTSGSTPQGIEGEDTVRGKIMVNQQDSSRIGGGVTEYIEQCADTIYNFVVQFMYVYYDEPHYISAMGQNGAAEMISIRNTDFTMDVNVTVKEGSLIPKDPLTERNEAMDLWTAQAIGLPELYSRLDFPDPMESAQQTLMWQMVAAGKLPPQSLFPTFGQPVQGAVNESAPGINNAGQNEQNPAPQPDSQPAVAQQSQQLLGSVPLNQPVQ